MHNLKIILKTVTKKYKTKIYILIKKVTEENKCLYTQKLVV